MNAREILEQAVREDVSDIFIVAGLPVSCRKNGNIIQTQEEKLFPKETEALLNEIYAMAGDRDMMNLLVHGDDDFSFAIPGVSRFRVSAYKQRGALSAVIRVITFSGDTAASSDDTASDPSTQISNDAWQDDTAYYDSSYASCEKADAVYVLTVHYEPEDTLLKAHISIDTIADNRR